VRTVGSDSLEAAWSILPASWTAASMWAVVAVAVTSALARLALFAGLDLYFDEAYYWMWSLRPAFGYYDHPPMVAYLAWLGRLLPGEVGLRVPFALCGALTVVLSACMARALSDRPLAPMAAAAFAATVPMLTLAGALVLPDGPLTAAFAAATWLLLRVRHRAWLLVGVAGGFALLSKYSAALFGIAVLVAALFDPTLRAQLRTRWPWLGTLVALAIFAPCLAWNVTHDFISFRFQGAHMLPGRNAGSALALVGSVIGGVGPIIVAMAAVFLARAGTPAARRLAVVTALPLLVCLVMAFGGAIHANWPSLVYPGVCAAAGAYAAGLRPKPARILVGLSVAFGLTITLGYALELRMPTLLRVGYSPIERFHGWREGMTQVARRLGEPAPFVIPAKYQEAAQLAYYGGFRRFGPTFLRRSQFDIWNEAPAPGERVVILSLRPVPVDRAEQILGRPPAAPIGIESRFAGAPVRTIWITEPGPGPRAAGPGLFARVQGLRPWPGLIGGDELDASPDKFARSPAPSVTIPP
jgi:hypothetical protein